MLCTNAYRHAMWPMAVVLALVLAGCQSGGVKPQAAAEQPSQAVQTGVTAYDDETRVVTLADEYKRALVYVDVGRYDMAEKALISLIERYPLYAGPYANLGIIYHNQQMYQKSEQAYKNSLERNPDNPDVFNRLGMLYREMGKFDYALENYHKAVSLDADYDEPYLNLGILHDLYLNQPDKALAMYKKYQSLQEIEDSQVKLWIADLERKVIR